MMLSTSTPSLPASRRLLLAGLLALASCGQSPTLQTASPSLTASAVGVAEASTVTNIAAVQGVTARGDAPSPLGGQTVTVEGVVTSVHTAGGSGSLRGFFVQEEDRDADGNPATSDGLFVFCASDCPAVTVGDGVRVTGRVSEFVTATQISAGSAAVTETGSGLALPSAVTVALPLSVGERERLEGMRVTATGVVTNNFTLGRGGSFDIADARIPVFTQENAPSVEGLAAYTAQTRDRTLRIDDGTRAQNPDPVIFARDGQPLSAGNTLRGGDRVTATGVLTYSNDGWSGSGSVDAYRLHTTSITVTRPLPRPEAPEAVGGTLRVASMNVLNYFTTLVTRNEGCTPNGVSSASRGANNCAEFTRQQDKIVSAIEGLNPDVLGVLEMQNDFDRGANSSIAQLVSALNTRAGVAGKYAYVNPGSRVGTDAISVAMIYQPARVRPVGTLAVLNNAFDSAYTDSCNRPTLAQTFQSAANGGRFTAVMVHLKSKGSACAALNDTDRNDGEGSGYQARLNAANAIVNWLNTNPTGIVESDRLLMGDLNAYRMERPLQVLEAGGYGNLFGPESYSYQFDGQWGSLDHALASATLRGQVTGRTKWHINSDEPTVLDYNLEFKSAAQQGGYFAPGPFRSSDHDPILVGLSLTPERGGTAPAPQPTADLTPDSSSVTVMAGGAAVTRAFSTVGAAGNLSVTVTPQRRAPALVTAPAGVAGGAPFNVTVAAPNGTLPGTYTYLVTVQGGTFSDSSLLTVTVQAPANGR